jgi:hypothetical protein
MVDVEEAGEELSGILTCFFLVFETVDEMMVRFSEVFDDFNRNDVAVSGLVDDLGGVDVGSGQRDRDVVVSVSRIRSSVFVGPGVQEIRHLLVLKLY